MPIVVSAENGTLPGDRLDEDERQGVEVGAGVELHAHRLLGRRVAGGAEHRARRLGPARLGERAGQAEVGDAHDAVLVEQEVRGLDVAVQDAARVRVLERGRDVAPDPRGLGDGEVRLLVEDRPQAAALEQLEHHERDVVLAPVVDGDDVRVVERRRDLGLGAEAAEERGVLGERGVQDLDRDAAPQAGVLGEVHAPARAGPDGRMQAGTGPRGHGPRGRSRDFGPRRTR